MRIACSDAGGAFTIWETAAVIEDIPVDRAGDRPTTFWRASYLYDAFRTRPDETSSVGALLGQARRLKVAVRTDRIPIRPGLAYGIAFMVHDATTEEITLKAVQRSSNACVLKASGEVVFHNDSLLKVRVGELRHIGARLPETPEENHCRAAAAAGTYTFELYTDQHRLASKTFQLYGPQ